MTQQAQVKEEHGLNIPHPIKASEESPATAEAQRIPQEVIDAIRTPLLVLGSGMRVRSANHSFYRVFQAAPADVEQCCLFDLDGGLWDIPRLRDLLTDALDNDVPFEDLEVEYQFPKIGRRTVLLNGRRLVRDAGAAPLILLALEDVTDRRRAEKQIQVYVQKLEWSNRELQDFAYIASHDLQEPLRAIQAFGERLHSQAGADLREDARGSLERMLRAATRMRGLINDLLEFSRITTNSRPFTAVDLSEVVQQARSDLTKRIEETGGCVEVGPLPAIEADASQMRQLLQNLMDNALKYGRDDTPPVVTVRGEVMPDDAGSGRGGKRATCRIEVRDNGIGFEQKYAERIFAPFQRLHGRGRYDGTGIGLAICRKIAERHGGRITAQSTPGVGSLFTILLPVDQDGEQ